MPYQAIESSTNQVGMKTGMGVGVVCGLVFMLALNNASPSASTMAFATGATAVKPATTYSATTTIPAVRANPQQAQYAAEEFVDFQGAAALDPLHLATPPANNGPQGFMGFAAILMASVASIAIVAKKFIAKAQAPLDPMDLFQNERIAMATIAMAPSKKSPFSKRREALEGTYEAKKPYSVDEALDLVKSSATAKFDETIDVAIRLNVDPRKADQMLRGSIVMPGGTGKNVRVAAFCSAENEAAAKEAGADFYGLDELAETIKKGEMGFDVVVATPDCMRVALQLGRILGPRGLMPNPKDGTVQVDIVAAIKNAKAGQVKFRTDKSGVVHCPIGKASFSKAALKENLEALYNNLLAAKPTTVKGVYVKNFVISSTMGVGISVDPTTFDS